MQNAHLKAGRVQKTKRDRGGLAEFTFGHCPGTDDVWKVYSYSIQHILK